MTTYLFGGQLIWRGFLTVGDTTSAIDIDLSEHLEDIDVNSDSLPFDKIFYAMKSAIVEGAFKPAAETPTFTGKPLTIE